MKQIQNIKPWFSGFFAVILSLGTLSAQDFWHPRGQINGLRAHQVVVHPGGDVYLASGNLIYRSADNGNSWSLAHTLYGGLANLEIDSDGFLYFLIGTELHRLSANGNLITLAANVFYYDLAPNGTVYVYRGNNQLWRIDPSTGAQTFLFTNADDPRGIACFGGDRNFCWTDDLGLTRFADDGSHALVLSASGFNENPTMVQSASGKLWLCTGGLRTSTNGGQNWSIYTYPAWQGLSVRALYANTAGDTLYAMTTNGWWHSVNEGNTWEQQIALQVSPYTQWEYNLADAAIAPNGAIFLCSSDCALQFLVRSTDNGQTWTSLSEQFVAGRSTKLQKDESGRLFALGCEGKIHRSYDDGLSWETLDVLPVFSDFEDMLVSPAGYLFALNDSMLYRSADGGDTWTSFLSPVNQQPDDPPKFLLRCGSQGELFCFDEDEGYAVYLSTDHGASWQLTNGQCFYYNWMHQHPDGTFYLSYYDFVSGDVHIRSAQDGLNWTPLSPQLPLWSPQIVQILPDGSIYFTARPQQGQPFNLYRTDTRFADWIQVAGSVDGNYQGMLIDNQHVMYRFNAQGLLLRSTDEGAGWNTFISGLNGALGSYGASSLMLSDDQYLYLSPEQTLPVFRSLQPVSNFGNLGGAVRLDADLDCVADPDETPLAGWKVRAQTNDSVFYCLLLPNKQYRMALPSAGDYQISALPPNALWAVCPDEQPLSFLNTSDRDTLDFSATANAACPYLRVSAGTPFLRRCFDNTYTLRYCNEGTADADSVRISVLLDPYFQFVSASVPVAEQSGQTLHFELGSLPRGVCGMMQLTVLLSCDAALGQAHCLEARATPVELCWPGLDSVFVATDCQPNRGSYDPNNKIAFVNGHLREADSLDVNEFDVLYQINFQNTGTDTAFRVVIRDTLSALLDPGSIRAGASSHPYDLSLQTNPLNGKHVLSFTFYPIALPDSSANPGGSQGFVQFGVRRKADLPVGTLLSNQAAIYFDYNEPVLTNVKNLVLQASSATAEQPGRSGRLRVWPNPASDVIRIEAGFDIARIAIVDMQGRIVKRSRGAGFIQINDLPAGVYRVLAWGGSRFENAAFVID